MMYNNSIKINRSEARRFPLWLKWFLLILIGSTFLSMFDSLAGSVLSFGLLGIALFPGARPAPYSRPFRLAPYLMALNFLSAVLVAVIMAFGSMKLPPQFDRLSWFDLSATMIVELSALVLFRNRDPRFAYAVVAGVCLGFLSFVIDALDARDPLALFLEEGLPHLISLPYSWLLIRDAPSLTSLGSSSIIGSPLGDSASSVSDDRS